MTRRVLSGKMLARTHTHAHTHIRDYLTANTVTLIVHWYKNLSLLFVLFWDVSFMCTALSQGWSLPVQLQRHTTWPGVQYAPGIIWWPL